MFQSAKDTQKQKMKILSHISFAFSRKQKLEAVSKVFLERKLHKMRKLTQSY